MPLPRLCLMSLVMIGGAASAATQGRVPAQVLLPAQEVRIEQAMQLDMARLLKAQAGDSWDVNLPRVGTRRLTLETVVTGRDGLKSWHGRLGEAQGDRIYLKQTKRGLSGGVRVAGRVFAVAQRGSGALAPTASSVACSVGSTGLYNCRVPGDVSSVTLRAAVGVKGRTITPASGTFGIDRMANTPVNATRFYVK